MPARRPVAKFLGTTDSQLLELKANGQRPLRLALHATSPNLVGGHNSNTAGGDYSFAAGRRARADHTGAFVWADATDADFFPAASGQFLVRTTGGVGTTPTHPTPRWLWTAVTE